MAAIESFRLYDHDDIKVTSEGRKIILTGIARSSDEKQIAMTVAWSVPGVTGIEDNIVVDGSEFGC